MGKPRILVVDDSEEVREFYAAAVQLAGYSVETAEDGAKALKMIKGTPFDLIVLDVVMPVMDGLQLLTEMRSDLAAGPPPTILCSGFDLTEADALRLGARRFLHKPVAPDDLLAAIRDELAGRAADHAMLTETMGRVTEARERARRMASDATHDLDAHAPPGGHFVSHLDSWVRFHAAYLGAQGVLAAFLRGDQLRVLSTSDPDILAVDADLGRALPAVEKVLETGSSLVLPDIEAHPSFSRFAGCLDSARRLMAVPIFFAEQAIGVLCIVDTRAGAVTGEDLGMVQLFSSRVGELLRLWRAGRMQDPQFRFGSGVAARSGFERMLELELQLLRTHGGSFELAVMPRVDPSVMHEIVTGAADPERLLAGSISDTSIAIYKRAHLADARARLGAVLHDLRGKASIGAVGVVDLATGGLASLHAHDLLHLAEAALEETGQASDVRRLVIATETE